MFSIPVLDNAEILTMLSKQSNGDQPTLSVPSPSSFWLLRCHLSVGGRIAGHVVETGELEGESLPGEDNMSLLLKQGCSTFVCLSSTVSSECLKAACGSTPVITSSPIEHRTFPMFEGPHPDDRQLIDFSVSIMQNIMSGSTVHLYSEEEGSGGGDTYKIPSSTSVIALLILTVAYGITLDEAETMLQLLQSFRSPSVLVEAVSLAYKTQIQRIIKSPEFKLYQSFFSMARTRESYTNRLIKSLTNDVETLRAAALNSSRKTPGPSPQVTPQGTPSKSGRHISSGTSSPSNIVASPPSSFTSSSHGTVGFNNKQRRRVANTSDYPKMLPLLTVLFLALSPREMDECHDEKVEECLVDLHYLFEGKKCILMVIPGAFSPICNKQLREYAIRIKELMALGIDQFCVVSKNDKFVMKAWGRSLGFHSNVTMIADNEGVLIDALGLTSNW